MIESIRREAFSLLEMLVVIAIIGVLIALIAPAIERVRDAASRAQCANNLRQIGIALHNYHGVSKSFPPGVSYEDGQGPFPFMSWHARILPFIDNETLWRNTLAAYETRTPFWENPPHVGFSTIMHVFGCPADPNASKLAGPSGRYAAFTTYLGVEGTNQYLRDGILFLDSRTRLDDVIDGASNTILVGERHTTTAIDTTGWWYAGYGQNKEGSAEMVLGVREMRYGGWAPRGCLPGPYYYGPGRPQNQCDALHFWSSHAGGGANFLFGDGTVRFLSYSINPIMPALATRAGGEPTNEN
jgi:prepilin-type N-terminal cleavage/methylation domain-containing protein/prepilin-type processing-associated H-X9-DG protein